MMNRGVNTFDPRLNRMSRCILKDPEVDFKLRKHSTTNLKCNQGIITMESSKTAYKCGQCSGAAHSLTEWNQHNRKLHPGQPSVLFGDSKLQDPKPQEPKEIPEVCSRCSKLFRNEKFLKKHTDEMHPTHRLKVCNYCPHMRFAQRRFLRQHWRIMHPEPYNRIINPKRRRQVDQAFPMFSCEDCHSGFKEIKTLNIHMTAVHGMVQSLRCGQCASRFFTPKRLDRHNEGECEDRVESVPDRIHPHNPNLTSSRQKYSPATSVEDVQTPAFEEVVWSPLQVN